MSDAASPIPRVLVVDDDGANLRTFARALRGRCEVVTAASGEEALEALSRSSFDIAFVDYAMPRMNGLELLSRMREGHASPRRVLLTAYEGLPEFAAALATGVAHEIMSKPWEVRDLLDAIARAPATPR